ncbi:MAG: 3-phosphoshikimate 1-carboxyvinyltransferase [Acidobacteriota bacterium]|nr:3-phosphoshikimate 1-carboxyvinyltransferase [Acidobacteriota bacterium]
MSTREVAAATRLRGSVRVPGDKSASHRAVMLSALAPGVSRIEGLSGGEDVGATTQIMAQLGATVRSRDGVLEIEGPRQGLAATDSELRCGNSGTTMRLLAGIVAGIPGEHHLVGDASLSRRPMDRVARPLRLMGAQVTGHGGAVTAPLRVRGARPLRAISYDVPIASAQVKSAILFAGLVADGATTVREARRTRSTTEDMMRQCGIFLTSVDRGPGREVSLSPGRPEARHWRVPGDPSQAAFFVVLAAIHRDAIIDIAPIDTAPERVGFVAVLERMGADVAWGEDGSLRVASSALRATEIHAAEIPSVDEVPALTVAAAAATGVSVFRDVGELRVKESDRFSGSMALAAALGCETWSEGDDFFVRGRASATAFDSFTLDVELDHRMVMAAAIAAGAGRGGVIGGADSVASSYPAFFDDLASLQ